MINISEVWSEIIDWASLNSPALLKSINSRNEDRMIDIAKDEIGFLDSQLWDLYKLIDGNASGSLIYPLPGLRILPLEELMSTTKIWCDLSREMDDDQEQDGVEVIDRGSVRAEYAYRNHLPFAADGAGNYLALDFYPEPLGTIGQVINIGVGESKRYVVSKDIVGLFSLILDLLKTGKIFVESSDSEKKIYCLASECYLFLDALPELHDRGLLNK